MVPHRKAPSAASISPSDARIFIFLAALLAIALEAPHTAFAEELREADVIRLARINNPNAQALAQQVAVRTAAMRSTGLRTSPQVAWQRETRSTAESEDSLTITVPVNRTRRQQVSRRLANVSVAEARTEKLLGGAEAVRRSLGVFYACLAQAQRIALAEETALRLTEAARIIVRRREEGSLSGYDVARIELALELARSQVAEAQAAYQSLLAELALRLNVPANTLVLRGALWSEGGQHLATAEGSESPALEALRSAAGVAERAEKRANALWLPTLSVTAGLRVVDASETQYGYVAGLSLNLPLSTGVGALRTQAAARTRQVRAQATAIVTERRIRSEAALRSLQGLRSEARRFESTTGAHRKALKLAVESGYKEGQRSLLELLDASQTLLAVRTRLLDLHLAAKRAELALRDARGEFE